MSDSVAQELWQGYNEQGEPSGVLTKSDARFGALHGASHVWIWRRTSGSIEILLQRRATDKATWAGHLDISAAGHIDAGETPLIAALRETNEELGLAVHTKDLKLITVHRANLTADLGGQEVIENEFQFVYLHEMTASTDKIKLFDGEVDETYWIPLNELQNVIDGVSDDVIVPHGQSYFSVLFEFLSQHNQT